MARLVAFKKIDPNNYDTTFESLNVKRKTEEYQISNNDLGPVIEPIIPVTPAQIRRTNSYEAALECMVDFDHLIDNESNYSSSIDDDMDGVQVRTGKRSKSVEDLLSVMKIDDEERFQFHLLDNFKQILNHESRHLALLNSINKFKYILKESKVSDEILTNIFYNIGDLIDAQNNLVVCIENMIGDWDTNKHLFTDIMDLYVLLHVRCKDYVKNITNATRELKILFEKKDKFFEAMNVVIYEGVSMRLEVLLAKPTNWLCNSLENIKNLIGAAEGHFNLKMVKETLEKLKDNSELRINTSSSSVEKNKFIRSGLFVELLPNDQRKLRHMFLFSGMLVCGKQKLHTDGNTMGRLTNVVTSDKTDKLFELKLVERLDVKWFIPLQYLTIHQSKDVENCDKRKSEISSLKDKIRDLRMQLISEKAKSSENFSFRKMMVRKDVERIHSQIMKAQADLLLLSPSISFLVSNLSDKPHNLLVFSVKDLEIWKRDIFESKKLKNVIDMSLTTLTSVGTFLESYRGYSSIIEVANAPLLRDISEEGTSGVVTTTIESVNGLNPVYSYYLTIEVDSFNINEVKAHTKKCSNNSSISWNESFDIDLDCSQTMNILLYQVKNYAQDKESLLGYFEFKLDKKDINNKTIVKKTPIFREESTMLEIKVSFKIKTRNDLMKRQPSLMKTSLFGISLNSIVTREKGKCGMPVENVPMIIQICLKKIEDEGIDEEGIYRISGSKNEILDFYKRLNKNVIGALKDISHYDLHTTTGIVKLYLRELPEPLMLTDNYHRMLEISNIADDVERYMQYTEVIRSLPEPNYSTVVYVLRHFKRVCEHSNKNQMVASNLGLIIGPTMMMPPCTNDKQNYTNFAVETMNSMHLSRVFTQMLHGICGGHIALDHSLSEL